LKLADVSEVRTASILIVIAMMMKAVRSSETLDKFNVTTRRYIPEDSKFYTRSRENLKSHTEYGMFVKRVSFNVKLSSSETKHSSSSSDSESRYCNVVLWLL
jgi:hypothetical protein